MAKLRPTFLLLACLFICFTSAASETSRPLRQTELLALVAGNALPENIINEIRTRGLAFPLRDTFRAQLSTAGAPACVLAAVDHAQQPANATSQEAPDPILLLHITAAGKLIREKHYQEAADELTAALQGNFEKFEIGFVMGELLRQQQKWGQATSVYAEVLRQDPNFPEAHTKLSFVLYRSGYGEEALREAKAALLRTPQNAEAHKNAGLALYWLGKPDAALAEYKEALRLKPDYAFVHMDIALVFQSQRDWDSAIAEFKKGTALDPNNADPHYDLGNMFQEKADWGSAIREFREAKRLDPHRFDIRMNLSAALVNDYMYSEAVTELRELEIMAPNSAMCHQALAHALHSKSDFAAAEDEYRKAAQLDPSDASIRLGLGAVFEDQKKYEAALQEYRSAEKLDDSSGHAHRNAGRVLVAMKRVDEALKELKQAEQLSPAEAPIHFYYGQALQLSGDLDAAIAEFKESLALEAKRADVRLELAGALEKKGDWIAALGEYQQAVADDTVDEATLPPGTSVRVYNAAQKYREAKERFKQHLGSLRKEGNASEAAQLEKSLSDAQSNASAVQKLDSLMQDGAQAFEERRFDDSERSYKQALKIAEKLQPLDLRLTAILAHLGQLAAFRNDFAGAEATFERQLKVTEELYGHQAAALADPLKWLAMNAMAQRDVPSAKRFLDRALEVNRKVYGENSAGYMDILRLLGSAYLFQESYDKAEPYLVQASEIERKLYDYDPRFGGSNLMSLATLCTLYERWNQPGKLEPCDRQLIVALDKQTIGANPQFLEVTLAREAKTLRTLQRPQEAEKIEQRLKSLQPSAANNSN